MTIPHVTVFSRPVLLLQAVMITGGRIHTLSALGQRRRNRSPRNHASPNDMWIRSGSLGIEKSSSLYVAIGLLMCVLCCPSVQATATPNHTCCATSDNAYIWGPFNSRGSVIILQHKLFSNYPALSLKKENHFLHLSSRLRLAVESND